MKIKLKLCTRAYLPGALERVAHHRRQPDALEAVVGAAVSHLDDHLFTMEKLGV
jgi:hypothetical protein